MSALRRNVFRIFIIVSLSIFQTPSVIAEPPEHVLSFSTVLDHYRDQIYDEVIKSAAFVKDVSPNERLALDYMLAHSYMKIKRYKEAMNYFQKTLPNAPYKYEIYNNMGVCAFYQKKYDISVSLFEKAISENPNYDIAIKNHSLITSARAKSMIEKNEAGEILELFSISSPGLNDVNLGWLYYYMGDYPEAIHLFKKAMKLDPEYVFAYLSLGYLYDSTNNLKTALKYYKLALDLDREYPDLWNNIGITYFFLGEEKLAIQSFEQAYDLNHKFVYPLNNLGFVYLHKSDTKVALEYFTKALEIESQDQYILSEIHAGLSICYFMQGDTEKAALHKNSAQIYNGNLLDKHYLSNYLRWNASMINIFLQEIK